MPVSLERMVQKQVNKVLTRGQRLERFDRLRQRHFWSSYLFAHGAGNDIAAGQYDIFKIAPSGTGQGYPAGTPLTNRETNWLNWGRVPDNQNFVINEIGVTLVRPPCVDAGGYLGAPANAPAGGIWANLAPAIQALINQQALIHPDDAANVLYGMNLEMAYLTNHIPMGYLADFSQSGGLRAYVGKNELQSAQPNSMGDAVNGIPAAAFRRKLEVPILLQHGENMGMRLNVLRPIPTRTLDEEGAGWIEVRVDWWASESFEEKS